MFVEIRHEDPVAIFLGKRVGQVDAGSAVGRAVPVIRDRFDIIKDIRVNVFAPLTVVNAAGNHMPKVRNHTSGDEHLAVIIKIQAPRIAETVGDHFKPILCRMIAPHSAVDELPVFHLNTSWECIPLVQDRPSVQRLADRRGRGKSLAAVKPTVRSPSKAIKDLVPISNTPARKAHFDITVRLVIVIFVRNKKQVRRSTEPQPVKSNRDCRGEGDSFHEYRTLIEFPVTVRIFEDENSTISVRGETSAARFVIPIFSDPEASAIIPAERHRLRNHGFDGRKLRLEPSGNRHPCDGLFPSEKSGGSATFLSEHHVFD